MRELLAEILHKADADLMVGGYRFVSVDPERVRRQLRTAGKPFVVPGGAAPELGDLDGTARWIVEQSRFKTTALAGFAGLAGAASVPPEIAAQVVGIVRLAQRLAVVYGFDPHTDRGRTVLWRALAAGLEVDVPEGPADLRVSDLPGVLRPSVTPRSVGAVLARALVYRTALFVAGRFGRFLPLLSSGVAAADSNRRTGAIGERMIEVFRRLSEPGALRIAEDAEEILALPGA